MAEVPIRVTSRGLSRVSGDFRKVEKSLNRVSRAGAKTTRSLSAGFGKMRTRVTRLTSVLGGLGLAFGARAIFDFDEALGEIQGKTGKTTAEMYQQMTFENWDFGTIWWIDEGIDYPHFYWEPGSPLPPVSLSVENWPLYDLD